MIYNHHKDVFTVACDDCVFSEDFYTGEDFDMLITEMRASGWLSYQPLIGTTDWQHQCPICVEQELHSG